MNVQTYRPFLKALYPIGVLLIVGATSEPAIQIWPLRLDEVRWRFGTAGLISGAMVGVMLGVVWLMVIAALLGHRRVLRGISVFCLFLAVFLAAVSVGFGLDFLQVRASVNPNVRGALGMTVLRAMVVLALSIPIAVGLGIGGWKSTRRATRAQGSKSARDVDLIFHTQPQGGSPV
jgi:hypothetical protein